MRNCLFHLNAKACDNCPKIPKKCLVRRYVIKHRRAYCHKSQWNAQLYSLITARRVDLHIVCVQTMPNICLNSIVYEIKIATY